MDAIREFHDAIRSAGLVVDTVEADGLRHRVKTTTDKGAKKSGWYVLYMDGTPAGAFGNWKTSETSSWCGKSASGLSPAERAAQIANVERARAARAAEVENANRDAKKDCERIWHRAGVAMANNPYLIRKKVLPIGIKAWPKKQILIVPIYDGKNNLVSLQFINAEGEKTFKSGGKVEGCYFVFSPGKNPIDKRIYFCEGYATGASLYMALNAVVVVCFNAGNMPAVAERLRQLSQQEFVFCIDVDKNFAGTQGGLKASLAKGGRIVMPDFGRLTVPVDSNPTDFNDLHLLAGLDEIRNQITDQLKNSADLINQHQVNVIQDTLKAVSKIGETIDGMNRLLSENGIDVSFIYADLMQSAHAMQQKISRSVIEGRPS